MSLLLFDVRLFLRVGCLMEEVAEPPGGGFMSQGGQALNNHVGIYRDMLEYRRII